MRVFAVVAHLAEVSEIVFAHGELLLALSRVGRQGRRKREVGARGGGMAVRTGARWVRASEGEKGKTTYSGV